MNYNILLDMAADLGYQLAISGAETYRVEDSVSRILSAYGISSEVFAIPTCLIVSIETAEGKPMTRMRRVKNISNNMDSVERYNALSRRICASTPDPEIATQWLKEAEDAAQYYKPLASMLGGFLTGLGFAIFFGGDVTDALCAGVCGILVSLINLLTSKLRINEFFSTTAASFVMALLAYVLCCAGTVHSADVVIISALMLLVPGLLFTNAMRDILFGDTNSGINRIVQVLLIAAAIALGTGSALTLVSNIWMEPVSVATYSHAYWIQCLAAFVACAGFVFVFNVHGKGTWLCMLGGTVTWAAYCVAFHFGSGEVMAYFFAAVVSAIYSEAMARIRKCPAISYLVVSLIPMFPGAGIYYATRFFVHGDMASCASRGSNTIAIAGAIAVGILTVSTLYRLYADRMQLKRNK